MIMTTNGLHSFLKISDLPLGGGFIDVWIGGLLLLFGRDWTPLLISFS